MSAPKWTPGDWAIDPNPDLPLAVIRVSDEDSYEDGLGVCEIGERTPENEANARLISAAPELYAALQSLSVAVYNDCDETAKAFERELDAARAALGKAVGK